jgi:hypothetical protein
MRPSSRPLFSWAFAAFFGCISLVGQGLHSFVGHSFHHAPGAHERHWHSGVDGYFSGGHDADGRAWAIRNGAWVADHDCPICSHFSQAQSNLYLATLFVAHFSSAALVAVTAQCAAGATSVYRSRAPPAALPLL